MNFDPTTHITGDQFAALVNMESRKLYAALRADESAPQKLFNTCVGRHNKVIFERAAAEAWAKRRLASQPARHVAAPRDLSLSANRRPYQPSAQMRINQQRAAELYPHRLITPAGIGNGVDHGQNKRRFAL